MLHYYFDVQGGTPTVCQLAAAIHRCMEERVRIVEGRIVSARVVAWPILLRRRVQFVVRCASCQRRGEWCHWEDKCGHIMFTNVVARAVAFCPLQTRETIGHYMHRLALAEPFWRAGMLTSTRIVIGQLRLLPSEPVPIPDGKLCFIETLPSISPPLRTQSICTACMLGNPGFVVGPGKRVDLARVFFAQATLQRYMDGGHDVAQFIREIVDTKQSI